MQLALQTASQLVTQAKQRIENLTPEQVAAELERGGVLLVDLREGEERIQKGAIPGAIHAPRGMLEFYADRPTKITSLSSSPIDGQSSIARAALGPRSPWRRFVNSAIPAWLI